LNDNDRAKYRYHGFWHQDHQTGPYLPCQQKNWPTVPTKTFGNILLKTVLVYLQLSDTLSQRPRTEIAADEATPLGLQENRARQFFLNC
jgi:hypothetical protein